MKKWLLFTLCIFTSLVAKGQKETFSLPKKIYTTVSLQKAEPPKIDGTPDDVSWNLAPWEGDFIESRPDENTAPSEQSRFKILYDAKFLYVAYQCYDSEPSKIEKRLSRRDDFAGDRITLVLDSYHDKRTAFSFTISAAGVKGDEFVSQNGARWDESWNPIWYAAAATDDQGWTAEIKIPLSQLKFGKSKEQVWGLQVSRLLFRADERSVWQRLPQDAPGYISEMGELHGLLNVAPQKQLEIQPFATAQLDTYPAEAGNPFRQGQDFKLNGGLDAKIGITNDLTLDLTVNPDFGQVEADPAAIALDGFQIFFREQRPFFVENKNIFDYDFYNGQDNLFYSRRIGRNPQGVFGEDIVNTEFSDVPTNTTILGAAKFSGKTKNGWSIGLLESVTAQEIATIEDEGGNSREAMVEPLTNYMIARVQKDFNERNSFIGGIFTATNRNLADIENIDFTNEATNETRELIGLRENNLNFLRESAYTGGLDFQHNWKDRNYILEGNLVASHVTGAPEAILDTQRSLTHLFQRSDASHVTVDSTRTSLSGTGGQFRIGKSGGGNWRYETGGAFRSPELELNDVGFLRVADRIEQFSNVQYLLLKPTKLYRSTDFFLGQFNTFDFQGNHNSLQFDFSSFMNFSNNWSAEFQMGYKPKNYMPSYLRGGPRFRFNEEVSGSFAFGSNEQKKFSFIAAYGTLQGREQNITSQQFVLEFNYQPLDALSLSINTEYEITPNKTQYITDVDFGAAKRYITGKIKQQTLSSSIRLNYSINPNLTIQYYGQPFISNGRYSDFNYVNNASAKNLAERVTLFRDDQITLQDDMYLVTENGTAPSYTFDNPDFAFVQFRSNLVVRWSTFRVLKSFWCGHKALTAMGWPAITYFKTSPIKSLISNRIIPF